MSAGRLSAPKRRREDCPATICRSEAGLFGKELRFRMENHMRVRKSFWTKMLVLMIILAMVVPDLARAGEVFTDRGEETTETFLDLEETAETAEVRELPEETAAEEAPEEDAEEETAAETVSWADPVPEETSGMDELLETLEEVRETFSEEETSEEAASEEVTGEEETEDQDAG